VIIWLAESGQVPNLLRPAARVRVGCVFRGKPVGVAGEGVSFRIFGPEDAGESNEDLLELGQGYVGDCCRESRGK